MRSPLAVASEAKTVVTMLPAGAHVREVRPDPFSSVGCKQRYRCMGRVGDAASQRSIWVTTGCCKMAEQRPYTAQLQISSQFYEGLTVAPGPAEAASGSLLIDCSTCEPSVGKEATDRTANHRANDAEHTLSADGGCCCQQRHETADGFPPWAVWIWARRSGRGCASLGWHASSRTGKGFCLGTRAGLAETARRL